MPQLVTAEGVDLLGPLVTEYPGTGPATDAVFPGYNPVTGMTHRVPGSRMPGAGNSSTPTPGVAGGAPQWVTGKQTEGALVFDAGITYRVRLNIANGTARPAAFPNGYLAIGPQDISKKADLGPDGRLAVSQAPGAGPGIVFDQTNNRYSFDYQPLVFSSIEKGARVVRTTGAIVRGNANKDYYLFETPVEPGVVYDLRLGTGDLENAAYFCDNIYLGELYNLNSGRFGYGEYSLSPLVPAGSNSNIIVLKASSLSPAVDQYVYPTQLYYDKPLAARVTALEQGGSSSTPGTARDPFAVGDNPAITAAVTAANWVDGDLLSYASAADQDAAAPPAEPNQNASILVGTADVATMDEFDMKDASGSAWRYRYSRRNDGTSGWTRTPKG
jgi:hypothetical protein